MIRDPFGGATRRSDAPDVHPIGHRTLHRIDERAVGGPEREVTVKTCGRGENLLRRGSRAGLAHVCWIARSGCVIDDLRAVVRPGIFGDAVEINLWQSAENWSRPNTNL